MYETNVRPGAGAQWCDVAYQGPNDWHSLQNERDDNVNQLLMDWLSRHESQRHARQHDGDLELGTQEQING